MTGELTSMQAPELTILLYHVVWVSGAGGR